MRFYYEYIDYERLFIRIDDRVYCFDLDELVEKIIDNGENIENYCNLALWNFSDAAFDLNDDEHLREFMDIIQSENVHEITYHQMVNIFRNYVMIYILENENGYTIGEIGKIIGEEVMDDIIDVLRDNLKEYKFIK